MSRARNWWLHLVHPEREPVLLAVEYRQIASRRRRYEAEGWTVVVSSESWAEWHARRLARALTEVRP